MPKYRYTGTGLRRTDGNEVEVIETGDVIKPTEAELDSFGDSLERVAEPTTTADAAPTTNENPPFEVGDLTVSEVEERLPEISDVDLLEEIEQREQENEARKGVSEAIKSRIEELR